MPLENALPSGAPVPALARFEGRPVNRSKKRTSKFVKVNGMMQFVAF
jgi:hypothetical protein